MSLSVSVRWVILALLSVVATSPRCPGQTPATSMDPTVRLFDAAGLSGGRSASRELAEEAGWPRVVEEPLNHPFQDSAVAMNDRLAIVLRQGGPGAEVYARTGGRLLPRAVLKPAINGGDARVTSVAAIENTPAGVLLDAGFVNRGKATATVRFALAAGQIFIAAEARSGAEGLVTEAPCRFAVLPDFFADDIAVDAADLPVDNVDLPSENFLLHLLPGGESIVMTVWQSRDQDVRVALTGDGPQRQICASQVHFGSEGKVWVAVLEGPGIWHLADVRASDAGKVIPLDWYPPYPAQWRVDVRRDDGLTGSWEMLTENVDGTFTKPAWFGESTSIPANRSRWTTVLGRFAYPCWIDRQGRGHLEPLARKVRFEGPALLYPINRTKTTPLDQFTVVDVVRATLGVGPCEYILDVEGQGAAHQGIATCGNRDVLNPIYQAGRQKQERARIEKSLTDVLIFVKHIRARIEQYVDFGHEMLGYLEEQKKLHPEITDFLAEMETLTRAIDDQYAARREQIRTPQYVTDLTEKFRRELLDYEGPDAFGRCKEITAAIVVVGGNQDELVGESRMAVKVLRQRAGLAMALDPRTAEIAKEIRDRTQKILRNALSYEAPRH